MNQNTVKLSKDQMRVMRQLELEMMKLDRMLAFEAELRAKYPRSKVVNDIFGPEKTKGGAV